MSTVDDSPKDVEDPAEVEKKGRFGGRAKGTPNKATANAKEAIARFVDENSEKLQEWLDEIRKTQGPQAAFRCYLDLIEYHVPKLSRAIVTGEDGPLEIQVSWALPKPVDAGGTITIAEDGTRITGYKELPEPCRCCGGDAVTHKANLKALWYYP